MKDLHLSPWEVHCDFDGTVSLQDVTDSLLQRFGQQGWQALEDAWERGELGSKDCMQAQVALLAMSADELAAHLDDIRLDPAFAAFAAATARRGLRVSISSDGLDLAIHALLSRCGLGGLAVRANRLVPAGPQRWQLDTPYARTDCERGAGNCKCAHVQAAHEGGVNVLYVGDGSSDFCVAQRADFVLAKDRLLTFCRERRIGHQPITGFADALAWLEAAWPAQESS